MARGLQGFLWTMLLLFCAIQELGAWAMHTAVEGPALGQPGDPALLASGRVKRGWVWNQFFVVEEYTGTEPLYVGKIHSDSDEGDGSIKYTISGEGAGTIFLIDEITGDIHATERLDREQKTFYTLRAQARDRQTDQLLEPESEFIIKVQDINDSEPRFLEGPYIGSVAELSPIGTSVMQVMASDADDPTYGSSARVVYSVLEGEQHFTVDSKTGVIRTAVADLDRETQDRYEVVIRATDMAGQLGGLSGSTTVTIVVTDVNDNPPRFPQKMYQFSIVETAPVGTAIGRVKAEDSDVGENTDMTYQVKDEEGVEMFKVTTDSNTQEAVIMVQKPLDYESKKVHTVVVEALNKFVDPRFVDLGTFRDQTIVRVSVLDVDEPPEFRPPSNLMEVQEDAHVGSVVGVVTALDPDTANHPVRYAIDRSTDAERIFDIDANTGAIVTGKVLDRETAGWHNITVLAMEADNHSQVSRASLRIRILDVNDNPPELATPYEAAVCEDAKPGQLIQTISVVDRDEPQSGHHFYFTLAPEANNHHFSLLDIKDNTAAVHTQRMGFNRQEQDVYLLPILVVDSGPPALSSTGTLTIRICGCDSNGAIQSCNSTAYVVSATLSPGALIALLVCILILVVLVLLILTLKRHHKSHLTSEDDEDMRDNVIKYNDEGGGEQDTEAYDMSALRSLYDFSEIKGGDGGGGPGEGGLSGNSASELHALPQWVQSPDLDFSMFRDYICRKVEQADEDLSVPPYDSFQTYAFEGSDSPVPSLSSINTWSSSSEQDFSYLGAWGPRFRQLAALYAGRRGEEDSEES
ncbi:cadherin-22 isoform X1 [Falco biarmicus]|uniref:LOW QUALITY PROTEIN: cadherin-22 n=1 Tax=Falco peregrinus TaxID=8954 RepID=UPI0003870C48|nr:cadherin-22 isoform X1 [Falco rusticolus]XP_055578897.1 cadherin-22 isoform X1 [Falco cherrug]XP_055578898.1 cadherin-22 isoform X1 [Falco cherrug]XP_055670594.1 LOW QUALITY PROTEIN: cadherin-22 [Falco peregrinus]XP_056210925.1 cadherin-22 isoform X1 [Falco biarmicus]XP_056210926.1 cadherin-22 isoform X1 [Falco biarmicus]